MRLSKYLIAVGAVVAAVPANAVGPNRDSLDAQYARKVLQNFAQCTVKLDHDLSRRFVLNGRGAITDEEFLRLADSRCLAIVPKLHMRQWQYRAALAQELIRRDLAASAVLNPRGVMPLTWTPLMVSLATGACALLLVSPATTARIDGGRLGMWTPAATAPSLAE